MAVLFLSLTFQVQAVGLGNIFGALMGKSGSQGHEKSVDDALIKVSALMNKKMPVIIDKDTRLDKVSAEPGQHLKYHYTLVGVRNGDVNIVEFSKAIKPQLKSRLCENIEMQKFLKSGVSISYLYRGNDGRAIGGAEFSPSDCGYKT